MPDSPIEDVLSLMVTHRGTQHRLSLSPESAVADMSAALEDLTSVPSNLQKLLYKGSPKGGIQPDMTLRQANFKDGIKIQLVGPTLLELDEMQANEAQARKRERILRERALKAPVKVRSTASSSTFEHTYRFHNIVPLPHLPDPDSALSYLRRLSNDKAIQHVMKLHSFSVGVLTELDPRERPDLLGLNKNAGEEILLRIRTDAYDGFRVYSQVRQTLCHELAHNVHGDHDEKFKRLNSQLNREVAAFEKAAIAGRHSLHSGDMYEPDELETMAAMTSHVLGGAGAAVAGDSAEERRSRLLAATMRRLQKEEEELENSCGTAGPAQL